MSISHNLRTLPFDPPPYGVAAYTPLSEIFISKDMSTSRMTAHRNMFTATDTEVPGSLRIPLPLIASGAAPNRRRGYVPRHGDETPNMFRIRFGMWRWRASVRWRIPPSGGSRPLSGYGITRSSRGWSQGLRIPAGGRRAAQPDDRGGRHGRLQRHRGHQLPAPAPGQLTGGRVAGEATKNLPTSGRDPECQMGWKSSTQGSTYDSWCYHYANCEH